MAGYATHWRRVEGSGLIYDGPCIIKAIIFKPFETDDYAEVYDGRDATSGEEFVTVISSVVVTWCLCLGEGVEFGRGIYVKGIDDKVETTVAFIPL